MKFLRKIISKMANLTPNVFYYSSSTSIKINNGLKKVATQKENKSTSLSLGCLALVCAGNEQMNYGDTLEVELTGVTDRGQNIGSFTVTVIKHYPERTAA